ncbi:MAG: hypothetical protein JWL75_277 [Parcubacteria group bacterium]|nr:hypothetical protein [Parcubacteria group bacterium]
MKQVAFTFFVAAMLFAGTPAFAARAHAICRDQTISYSIHRSGTCSHHGGVKKWLY